MRTTLVESVISQDNKYKDAEIKVAHKVLICWKCGHIWHQLKRKGKKTFPKTCPNHDCRSTVWFIAPKKSQRKSIIADAVRREDEEN